MHADKQQCRSHRSAYEPLRASSSRGRSVYARGPVQYCRGLHAFQRGMGQNAGGI